MIRLPRLIASVGLVLFASLVFAEEANWHDLIDKSAQNFEDPYIDLDDEQLGDLVIVARETARLEADGLSDQDRDASSAKIRDARGRLSTAGIDADWMISQRWVVAERREKAATAANPEIDGATITLGGFAIPAPPDEDGTPVVYLVPERGMCSHMPPPNPNQMIRARLNGDWSPQMMHEPVKLTGTLTARDTQHEFRIVDGDVPMRASFVMEVEAVQTMPAFSSQTQQNNEWATKLAEQLRASGQLRTQNPKD